MPNSFACSLEGAVDKTDCRPLLPVGVWYTLWGVLLAVLLNCFIFL